MAAPPAPVPPATANSAPAHPQRPHKSPPFSQPPSTAGTVKAEIPPASVSVSTAPAAGVAAAGAVTEGSSYIINIPSYSAWFSYESVSDTERRLMPEFFEGEVAAASGSRGPEAYKYYRDTLVKRFRARPARRLTLTEARRGLIGDVGSVRRVFDFLEEWGLINYGTSAPGVKQGRDKREEVAASQPSLPAGATISRKLCIGCGSVCRSAYFTCEKADISLCCRCYVRAAPQVPARFSPEPSFAFIRPRRGALPPNLPSPSPPQRTPASASAQTAAAQMMLRQCVGRAFLAEGSSSITLHAPGSRCPATSSSRNFHRCCVRASLWKTDHLQIKNAQSEIKVHTLLQVPDFFGSIKSWSKLQLVTVSGLAACVLLLVPSAGATDALKTCTCLLKECRIELAKCIANPSCAANVACLNTCNNRPDETECQIKCADLFGNSVVDEFNECAVSRKKCVPQKSDVGEFPVPDPSALVKNFNMADFTGKWYITSGLNPTFDAFDCQLHEFHLEGDRLVANLAWRIPTPDTGFFTRGAVQSFVQDPAQPGILYNHDNEYLHYQDDWYILSSQIENKEDDYIFVYYRGRNDAWDGYGGAVIYTRSKELPETIVPELERAAKSVGRDFSTFIRTDNTCGPQPALVDRIEKTVEKGEKIIIDEVKEIEGEIEGEVEELEKEEETLVKRLAEGIMEVKQDVMNFFQGLSKEEMEILDQLNLEATEVEELFSRSLPIRKLR